MIIERAMPLGGSVTIDGEDVTDELALKSGITAEDIFIDIPKTPVYTGVVYINGIIYALCYENSTKYFYKYDGESWTKLATPEPYYSTNAEVRCTVFNNELYVLSNYKDLHKYDGESWTHLTNLPISIYNSSMFVYNNELHMVSGRLNGSDPYYKWNGESLIQVSIFAKDSTYQYGYSFPYNGKIYCYHQQASINDTYYPCYDITNGIATRCAEMDDKIICNSNVSVFCSAEYQGKLYYTYCKFMHSCSSGLMVYDGQDKSSIHASTMSGDTMSSLCISLFNVEDKIWLARSDKKIVLASRKMYYNEKEKIL